VDIEIEFDDDPTDWSDADGAGDACDGDIDCDGVANDDDVNDFSIAQLGDPATHGAYVGAVSALANDWKKDDL